MGGSVRFMFEDFNRSRGLRELKKRKFFNGHFETMSILIYFFLQLAVVLLSDDLTN